MDPILKHSCYRGQSDLPKMEGDHQDLSPYLVFLLQEIQAQHLSDPDGQLKRRIEEDLKQWQELKKQTEVLDKQYDELYEDTRLTEQYLTEVLPHEWLDIYSMILYGVFSNQEIHIYKGSTDTPLTRQTLSHQQQQALDKLLPPKQRSDVAVLHIHFTHITTRG
jgi:hypothetical protein